jgi:predicted component of viral defense system (DUF524 family)
MRENRQANADLIRKQKERIEKDIRDLRETMNKHLDKLQEKLTRELMEVEIKTNNGIQELLTTLQRKEEEIYTILPLDRIQHPFTSLRPLLIVCFNLSITSLTDLSGILTTLC